jgi:hypothetical protein
MASVTMTTGFTIFSLPLLSVVAPAYTKSGRISFCPFFFGAFLQIQGRQPLVRDAQIGRLYVLGSEWRASCRNWAGIDPCARA